MKLLLIHFTKCVRSVWYTKEGLEFEMSSALKYISLIVVLVELCCVVAIQVPIYPPGYSERYNNHPKALRQISGYRISSPKHKKQTSRAPVYREQINFNSPSSLSDAIRIVDPPNFFQEQKKYFHKVPSIQFGNLNVNKPPTASAWKQREPLYKGNDYHPPPKFQDGRKATDLKPPGILLKYQTPFRQVEEFRQPVRNIPQQSHPPTPNRQEHHHHTTPAPKRHIHPSANIQKLHELENPPKYVTSHQSIIVEQPQPTPTYLGIQTPNSGSIRAQLHDFKEQQKSYFHDDEDHFPIRPKTTTKKYRKPISPSSDESPTSFGHEIYNEEKEQFHKTKGDYFGVKTHTASTTPDPDHAEPTFVPFKMLASVRHTTRVTHKKRNPSDPRAKARFKTQQAYTVHSEQAFEEGHYDHGDEERHIEPKKQKNRNTDHLKNSSTKRTRSKRSAKKLKPKEHVFIKKVQTVYSEQGYEDLAYDHGDEDRHADYTKKYRPKRSINSKDSEEIIEELEELPVALSLVGPDGEKLTGTSLIDHITELLKNSSKYIPDEDSNNVNKKSDFASVILPPEELDGLLKSSTKFGVPKTFSEHHLDTSIPSAGSPGKYIKKIPDFKVSPYRGESGVNCAERDYNFEQNDDKKKLGDLGEQLDCYKEKFFGNNPFSNPFFNDEVIPGFSSLKAEEQNPSSLVYDDVMKTIQNSLKSEKHLAAVPAPFKPVITQRGVVDPSKFESFTHTSTVSPNMVYKEIYTSLPIFDITKYFPKVYMIRPNGKIYSIKFRPKQPTPAQSEVKKTYRNPLRGESGKTVASRNPSSKRRIIEPTQIYKFSHEDAIRRPPRQQLRSKAN